jgi:hypothetical protein
MTTGPETIGATIWVGLPRFPLSHGILPFRFGNISSGRNVKGDMKILRIAAGATLFACNLAGFSQSDVPCGQMLDAPLRSSAMLTIDSRPAGLEIVGTDHEAIHISCTADDTDSARRIRLRFSGTPNHAKLTITGAYLKHGNLKIRVEVPRKTNLGIQMPAGEVKVDEIVGDKDIELHAGHISISSAREWDYRNVNASVDIGEVNARVYGADKGGFFRVFRKENADAEYRLHAHVTTGQIDLLGKNARAAADSQ